MPKERLARLYSREGRSRLKTMLNSVLGCYLSLLILGLLARRFFPETENLLLMAAFGSSAILIFTVPELITAQPWSAVMGHLIAALVGVFVRENLPLPHFASLATAVSLSLFFMFITASIHPPAGGTSIVALNCDGYLASLGYWLALFPMALGMIILVVTAMLYLNLVAGRSYPLRRSYRVIKVEEKKPGDS